MCTLVLYLTTGTLLRVKHLKGAPTWEDSDYTNKY